MIKIFKGNDTVFTSNGDKIIKAGEAIITKNVDEEYLELEAPLEYVDYLVQDNILIVDTLTGKKGYRINNPIKNKIVSIKANLCYQENTPYASDRGVNISYGKNLEDCKVSENWDDVVTKIIPIGYNEAHLPEGYIEISSPHQRIYEKTVEFDLSDHLVTTIEQLEDTIEEKTSLVANLTVSIDNLETKIDSYGGIITNLEAEIVTIQARIDDLGTSETELKEKAVLEAQLDEIGIQITLLTAEKTATETALTQTQTDLTQAQTDLTTADTTYGTTIINDLRAQAQAYLNNNLYPHVNYDLAAHLKGITELGDTVHVRHSKLKIDMLAYITQYKYNCLTQKFEELQFGTQRVSLKSKITSLEDRVYSVTQATRETYTLIEQLSDQIVLKIDSNGRIGLFRLGRDEYGTEIFIKADNIRLEGLITANGGFKIYEDGSFSAVKGTIAGFDVVPENSITHDGGLIYDELDGKYIRISPYSSMDGNGGYNTDYGAIDLGLSPDEMNTLVHLRSDGYARFGLVSEGGVSVRFNDFLRPNGTDTILYSQNFRINRDGTVEINSDSIAKPIKSIDVSRSDDQISKLNVTFEDNSSTSLDVEYNAGGDITKVGNTVINY